MQKFLKENDIRFRVTRNPDIKVAVVELFNRTLKERMWRYFIKIRDVMSMFYRTLYVLTITHVTRPRECNLR